MFRRENKVRSKAGVTLVEVMLAGAIVTIVSLALFEGVAVAARIAHENSQLLAADAYAWDTVWKRFNEAGGALLDQADSMNPCFRHVTTLPMAAAPALHLANSPARCTVTISNCVNIGVMIAADVEWGPSSSRRHTSARLYRADMNRVYAR